MTDAELIARLLYLSRVTQDYDQEDMTSADYADMPVAIKEAADRIEALMKERDEAVIKRAAWELKAKQLESALRVARVHVANNAEGWSVSRGAARNDLIIVEAALTDGDN